MLLGKLLRTLQVPDFQPGGFPQLDAFLNEKNRFTTRVSYVNVDWPVVVGIKEKPKSVLLEDGRHEPENHPKPMPPQAP